MRAGTREADDAQRLSHADEADELGTVTFGIGAAGGIREPSDVGIGEAIEGALATQALGEGGDDGRETRLDGSGVEQGEDVSGVYRLLEELARRFARQLIAQFDKCELIRVAAGGRRDPLTFRLITQRIDPGLLHTDGRDLVERRHRVDGADVAGIHPVVREVLAA